jgi:hypothetical protein
MHLLGVYGVLFRAVADVLPMFAFDIPFASPF